MARSYGSAKTPRKLPFTCTLGGVCHVRYIYALAPVLFTLLSLVEFENFRSFNLITPTSTWAPSSKALWCQKKSQQYEYSIFTHKTHSASAKEESKIMHQHTRIFLCWPLHMRYPIKLSQVRVFSPYIFIRHGRRLPNLRYSLKQKVSKQYGKKISI